MGISASSQVWVQGDLLPSHLDVLGKGLDVGDIHVFCQTPVQAQQFSSVKVGQGVDFVFPPSQQEQEEEEEEEEPSPKSTTSRHTRRLRFGMLT